MSFQHIFVNAFSINFYQMKKNTAEMLILRYNHDNAGLPIMLSFCFRTTYFVMNYGFST